GFQRRAQEAPDLRLVLDHQHARTELAHERASCGWCRTSVPSPASGAAYAAALAGSEKRTAAPPRLRFSAQMRPPWAWTTLLQIARPRPRPDPATAFEPR